MEGSGSISTIAAGNTQGHAFLRGALFSLDVRVIIVILQTTEEPVMYDAGLGLTCILNWRLRSVLEISFTG